MKNLFVVLNVLLYQYFWEHNWATRVHVSALVLSNVFSNNICLTAVDIFTYWTQNMCSKARSCQIECIRNGNKWLFQLHRISPWWPCNEIQSECRAIGIFLFNDLYNNKSVMDSFKGWTVSSGNFYCHKWLFISIIWWSTAWNGQRDRPMFKPFL